MFGAIQAFSCCATLLHNHKSVSNLTKDLDTHCTFLCVLNPVYSPVVSFRKTVTYHQRWTPFTLERWVLFCFGWVTLDLKPIHCYRQSQFFTAFLFLFTVSASKEINKNTQTVTGYRYKCRCAVKKEVTSFKTDQHRKVLIWIDHFKTFSMTAAPGFIWSPLLNTFTSWKTCVSVSLNQM